MKKTFIKYVIMILICLGGCCIVAELGLRLLDYKEQYAGRYKHDGITDNSHYTYDEISGYSLIPQMRDPLKGITTDVNGNRISAHPFDPQKQSIVFVGDSTVFGWGVRDEETFVYKLSQDKRFENYNFVNLGVPSYSLAHIAAVLEHKVPQYNPKIVFIAVLWPWKAFESYGDESRWLIIDNAFYKENFPKRVHFVPRNPSRSRLVTFFRDRYLSLKYKEHLKENFTRPGIRDFTLSPEKEQWYAETHVEKLHGAINASSLKDVKIVFYIHPYQYTIFHEDYLHLGQLGYDILVQNLPALDLKPVIKKAYTDKPLYIDGSHLTPEGNDVFKDIMTEALLKTL